MLNKAPIVISAICSWLMDRSGRSPSGKRLLRRLQDVLCGTDGARKRPPRNSDQIPVRLGVGRLLEFRVLTPSNTAVAYGIRLDLTLTLNIVHMQPFSVECPVLSVSYGALSLRFCISGERERQV